MTELSIDTGDVVRHEPSGEEWLVAFVRGDNLCACGWPCSFTELKHCTLVKKATAQERADLLKQMADMNGDDPRKSYARAALQAHKGGTAA